MLLCINFNSCLRVLQKTSIPEFFAKFESPRWSKSQVSSRFSDCNSKCQEVKTQLKFCEILQTILVYA